MLYTFNAKPPRYFPASKRPLFPDIRRRAAGVERGGGRGEGGKPAEYQEKRPLLAGNCGKK